MKSCTCEVHDADGPKATIPLARCSETSLLLKGLTPSCALDILVPSQTPNLGYPCGPDSFRTGRPAEQWPNLVVWTGGCKCQFDNQNRDHQIHDWHAWEDHIPQKYRVILHDVRALRNPDKGEFHAGLGDVAQKPLIRFAGSSLGDIY